MVSLATLLQTVIHPGIFFPRLSAAWKDPNVPNSNEKLDGYSSGEGKYV